MGKQKYEQPFEVDSIWDNGGTGEENGTMDRYSIHLIYTAGSEEVEYYDEELICTNGVASVSSRAEMGSFDIGEHLGEEIEWGDLPEELQGIIVSEVKDWETAMELQGYEV